MSMKQRIYYKINIVLILSAVMLMSAGCNFLKPSEADKMNVYLSDKYGDSFTYLTTVDYNGIGSKEACIFRQTDARMRKLWCVMIPWPGYI